MANDWQVAIEFSRTQFVGALFTSMERLVDVTRKDANLSPLDQATVVSRGIAMLCFENMLICARAFADGDPAVMHEAAMAYLNQIANERAEALGYRKGAA